MNAPCGGSRSRLIRSSYRLNVVENLRGCLALQNTHENQERNRVHDGSGGDAVDEPLGQRVAQAELGLDVGLARIFLQDGAILGRLQVDIADVLLLASGEVARECALQVLLPDLVWWRSQESKGDEAKQLE